MGVEFAGKIKTSYPQISVTLIHSRDRLLPKEPLPEYFKSRVLEMLRELEVEVILGQRGRVTLVSDNTYRIYLDDHSSISADKVIWSASNRTPSTGFLPDSALNEDRTIRIDAQWVPTIQVFPLSDDSLNTAPGRES